MSPSLAWRNSIFGSPERIDVEKTGKSTTRIPVNCGWSGREVFVNGLHERAAALICEEMWLIGQVKRWKSQPFNLTEIDGPDAVPDLLIELRNGDLHVVECKANRFLVADVTAKFDLCASFLKECGIGHHVWTERNHLSSLSTHTLNELERGRHFPAPQETVKAVANAAKSARVLGDLLNEFSWDDALSAAAHGAFFFNFLLPVDEKTPVTSQPAMDYCTRLFVQREQPGSWWEQLMPVHRGRASKTPEARQ